MKRKLKYWTFNIVWTGVAALVLSGNGFGDHKKETFLSKGRLGTLKVSGNYAPVSVAPGILNASH